MPEVDSHFHYSPPQRKGNIFPFEARTFQIAPCDKCMCGVFKRYSLSVVVHSFHFNLMEYLYNMHHIYIYYLTDSILDDASEVNISSFMLLSSSPFIYLFFYNRNHKSQFFSLYCPFLPFRCT